MFRIVASLPRCLKVWDIQNPRRDNDYLGRKEQIEVAERVEYTESNINYITYYLSILTDRHLALHSIRRGQMISIDRFPLHRKFQE